MLSKEQPWSSFCLWLWSLPHLWLLMFALPGKVAFLWSSLWLRRKWRNMSLESTQFLFSLSFLLFFCFLLVYLFLYFCFFDFCLLLTWREKVFRVKPQDEKQASVLKDFTQTIEVKHSEEYYIFLFYYVRDIRFGFSSMTAGTPKTDKQVKMTCTICIIHHFIFFQ